MSPLLGFDGFKFRDVQDAGTADVIRTASYRTRYRGFTFRYVQDSETAGAIRIYVESMPDLFRGASFRDLHLTPTMH